MHPLTWLRTQANSLGGSLWFLPSIGVATAIVLGTVLARVQVASGLQLASVLYAGDAAGARGLLQAIAGSMISVTGVTFSLTVVALQLASAQYSPRLLQNFLRDRGNQVVLTGFLSTFAYAIAVLRTIGARTEEGPVPVPSLAVTCAIALTLTSLGLLVYFVNHLAQSIRVESIIERAKNATLEALERQLENEGECLHDLPTPPQHAIVVAARRSGYLRFVDLDGLADQAREHNLRLQLVANVGDHVIEGGRIAWAWSDHAGDVDRDTAGEVLDNLVYVGRDRTLDQDIGLGIRQLADVAVKALSPGVNDPTSAIQTMNALTVVFVRLARDPLGHQLRRDDDGSIRALVPNAPLARYLRTVTGQIRRYGASQPEVIAQLLQLLADVGSNAHRDATQHTVSREVDLVLRGARQALDEADLEEIEHLAREAHRAVAGSRQTYPTGAA